MPIRSSHLYDVVIAGAGPVGLFLACELRLAGVSVLVLEQAPHPHAALKQRPFGMRGLSVPTVEALHRRGLLDDLLALHAERDSARHGGASHAAHWMQPSRRPGGHFAGISFFQDNIDSAQWPYRLPNPAESTLATDMACMETVLARRAAALGVELRRGLSVQDFTESDDHVTLHAGDATLRARWLVGCDGGRSTVRKTAGFEFTGTAAEFTGYSVQVALADPDELAPDRHYTPTGMYTYEKPGTIAMVDFDGGACHRTQSLSLAHVQAVLRHISGTGVTLSALQLATTWTDRAYQAGTYRKGRVLLAGDAAHIHSPLGGQGLNLGLGDAMNLGWKLAATIRGDAPPGLLDTYVSERHPVGAQVLDWSRAQVALMRPAPSSRALAAIVRDLIDTRDGATYFARRVWGVGLQYALGGSHPMIGRSAPEFALADGSTLASRLRDGKGLLLDFDAAMPLKEVALGWRARVTYVAIPARDTLGVSAVLVRPDGIVAWAGDAAPDPAGLASSAARWFGKH